tara:strand:- start:1882 stop:2604 length:723 start_codon:yes stop_codon:yes gene_type:complete
MAKLIKRLILLFIPLKIANYLFFFLLFFFKKKKSYSQFGEDLIIQNFFKYLNLDKGFFIDIGAYHPSFISNTKLLRDNGWKGVYVEADKTKCDLIKFYSKNFKVINKAVFPKKNIKSIFFYKFNKIFSEIDTISIDQAKKKAVELKINYKVEKIETITLNEILTIFPKIDFLNIDIEGLDEMCLLNTNLKKSKIKLIVFESLKIFNSSKIKIFLKKHNYEHLFTSGKSVGFYNKNLNIFK